MAKAELITREQRDIVISSMQSRFSKFKNFKYNNWVEGKLVLFQIPYKNEIYELIGECVYNDREGRRKSLLPQYSKYIYFRDLEEEYCITLLEGANFKFKDVPTSIQVENKYKKLMEDLERKGRLKILEATDISIKLQLLRGVNKL